MKFHCLEILKAVVLLANINSSHKTVMYLWMRILYMLIGPLVVTGEQERKILNLKNLYACKELSAMNL